MEKEEIYKKVINTLKLYHPSKDFSLVEKAYNIADKAHEDQYRKSGEHYIIHPLSVALILAELELDIETIVAGILHDIIEDTEYDFNDISKLFGEEVALLVDGVTKLDKIEYTSREEQQAENYRKMFLSMSKDIRVILIKVADRLHNMRTLNHMPPEKQKYIAQETIDIYAPLARRLGISKIQYDLEDLSFYYLFPEEYKSLDEQMHAKQHERDKFINNIAQDVKNVLSQNGIKVEVAGRTKHYFSIYKKMKTQDKTLDQIYDLFAIRIITDDANICYSILGLMHANYIPLDNRYKDYVARPKANGYKSIHTTVMGNDGEPFEIQIRTWEMHRFAEYGIAAHWRYKEGKNGESKDNLAEAKLAWLREILDWQRDLSDNTEFLKAIKSDLDVYTSEIYCFTPKGEVRILPVGSTPIDFAYSIHSAVGNKMVGAKVNGDIVKIDSILKTSDKIEIMTNKTAGPKKDWLKMVKTNRAKNKIMAYFKVSNKDENIERGKQAIEREGQREAYPFKLFDTEQIRKDVAEKFTFQNWEALCAVVGHGSLRETTVIKKMVEEYEKTLPKEIVETKATKELEETIAENNTKPVKDSKKSGIVVKGVGDISVRFSKCCNPVPGDDIIGFVTRGRGVSIHRRNCINMLNLVDVEKNRLMEATWNVPDKGKFGVNYRTELVVKGEDRTGMFADLSNILRDSETPIKSMNARTKDFEVIVEMGIEIRDKYQLETITRRILAINGVTSVERVNT